MIGSPTPEKALNLFHDLGNARTECPAGVVESLYYQHWISSHFEKKWLPDTRNVPVFGLKRCRVFTRPQCRCGRPGRCEHRLYPAPGNRMQRPDPLRLTMVLAKPKVVGDAGTCNRHLVAVLTASVQERLYGDPVP